MNSGELLICLGLAIPLFGAAASYAVGRMPDVRETLTLVMGVLLCVVTVTVFLRVGAGDAPGLLLAQPVAGLEIAFRLEPLGALFGLMASVLWVVNSLFALGYMRGRHEPHQTRYYVCAALAMFAVMGIAMAANLLTLFVFYEVLTFATYPLVINRGEDAARRAGRTYLLVLTGASLVLFLPGIIGVASVAGSTRFIPGGILEGRVDDAAGSILLLLLILGSAKAALMPLHGWLPGAVAAPAPVSALLHAVAVVTAGVFVVLKIAAYTFGSELITRLPGSGWLLWLAAGSVVLASLIASTKDDLRARLAWSTVSQLSCVISAALLPMGTGVVAGGLYMVFHSVAMLTLIMAAGAIYVATGISRVSDIGGLGRRMPAIFACFLAAAFSLIGFPPFAGMWSRFLLMDAAFKSHEWWTALSVTLSSLLCLLYLAPVGLRAMLASVEEGPPPSFIRPGGARGPMMVALILTAGGCLVLFAGADYLADYLSPVAGDLR